MKSFSTFLVEEDWCTEATVFEMLDQQERLTGQGIYKSLGQIMFEEGRISAETYHEMLVKLCMSSLKSMDLFQGLSEESLQAIAEVIDYRYLPPSTTFIHQGERGDFFCIICSGQVRIYRVLEDRVKVDLNTLGPGQCLGEMSLFTGKPRAASVETMEPTVILVIAKKDFDWLLKIQPSLSFHFVRVLSEWLIKVDGDYAAASVSEQAYQQFVSEQNIVPREELIGQSRVIRRLRDRIKVLASRNRPVLVTGEPGTEKLCVAGLLHRDSGREGSPFLRMNAKTPSLNENDHSSEYQDDLHLEIAQKSTLFGHEKGDFSFAQSSRLGLLEVGNAGTTVIEDLSSLCASTQKDLADFLKSSEFRVLNAQRVVYSSTLVIATDDADPVTLRSQGSLNPGLLEHFLENSLTIPPLRKRKRDLALIVEALIQRFNQQTGKCIQGIEREAYSRIMAYNWPGNMEELEVVIRRAVNLAQANELKSEDVFIGMTPITGKLRFNLLRLDKLRSLFSHRAYPLALQIFCAFFFAVILYEGFWGTRSSVGNIALPLTWGLWEPMIIMSAFLAARFWCAACPIGALNEAISRYCSLGRRVPHFIRQYGFWLGAIGLGLIFWAEVAFHLPFSARGTAILISAIALLGIVFGLLFQRRSWCRYVCPLGYLIGTFAQCSALEVRSNSGICNNECLDHRCYVDSRDAPGCPMFQAPFSLTSNLECILCARCVKSCPHQSTLLNLRVPGDELFRVSSPSQAMNVLVPVILGSQLFRALDAQGHFWNLHHLSFGGVILAIILMALSLAAWYFIRISGAWSFDSPPSSNLSKGGLFNYGLLPLIFAFEIAYQLEAMFSRSGNLIPALGQKIGFNWGHLDLVFSQGGIFFWQALLILGGLFSASIVLNKISQNHPDLLKNHGWKKQLPLLLLSGYYLWYFASGL